MLDEYSQSDAQAEVTEESIQLQESQSTEGSLQGPQSTSIQTENKDDWQSRYRDQQKYINQTQDQLKQERIERENLSAKLNGMAEAISTSLGHKPSQEDAQINPYELVPKIQSEMDNLRHQNQLMVTLIGRQFAESSKKDFEATTLKNHFGDNEEFKQSVFKQLEDVFSTTDDYGNKVGLQTLVERGHITYEDAFSRWMGYQFTKEGSDFLDKYTEMKNKAKSAASQNFIPRGAGFSGNLNSYNNQEEYNPIKIIPVE